MIKYNISAIAAAFSTMGRLVNAEKPVIFTKLGLNRVSCTLFKEAVTHTFKDENGNVILKRLFIVNEDGVTYHFNTSVSPDYRTDPELPSRIAQAMTIVGRKKREDAAKKKTVKKAEPKAEPVRVEDLVYNETTGEFEPKNEPKIVEVGIVKEGPAAGLPLVPEIKAGDVIKFPSELEFVDAKIEALKKEYDEKLAKYEARKTQLLEYQAKKERLDLICSTAEISINDLFELINDVKRGI